MFVFGLLFFGYICYTCIDIFMSFMSFILLKDNRGARLERSAPHVRGSPVRRQSNWTKSNGLKRIVSHWLECFVHVYIWIRRPLHPVGIDRSEWKYIFINFSNYVYICFIIIWIYVLYMHRYIHVAHVVHIAQRQQRSVAGAQCAARPRISSAPPLELNWIEWIEANRIALTRMFRTCIYIRIRRPLHLVG